MRQESNSQPLEHESSSLTTSYDILAGFPPREKDYFLNSDKLRKDAFDVQSFDMD
jgi:hypothetical protein